MNCHICKRVLDNPEDPMSTNCGGDCLWCMADAGDPDAIKAILKPIKEKALEYLTPGRFFNAAQGPCMALQSFLVSTEIGKVPFCICERTATRLAEAMGHSISADSVAMRRWIEDA